MVNVKMQGEEENMKVKMCDESHREISIRGYIYVTTLLKHGKAQKSRPDVTNTAIALAHLLFARFAAHL